MAHLDTFLVLVGHLDTSWHMILARCGDGFTEGMEMLEASRMDRTDVTQGDLEELCESSVGGNMRQEDVSFLPTYHRFDSPYASILEPTNNRRGLNLTNRPATDCSFNPGLLGLPSPSSDLLTPGEGSSHTPASVESASRTLTGFDISNIFFILLLIFFGSNIVRSGNAHP